jgi:hypothetical protein
MANDNLISVPIRFNAAKTKGKVYYFEWTINGGHVPFGMFGTINEWEAKKIDILDKMKDKEFMTLHKMIEQ